MRRAHPRFTVSVVTLFALVTASPVTGFAQDVAGPEKAAREKAAREVAVAYAKAYNAAIVRAGLQKKRPVDDILKVAAVPFFAGKIDNLQGSVHPAFISPVIFKKEDELRKHFIQSASRLGNPRPPLPLPVEVQRIESYADCRTLSPALSGRRSRRVDRERPTA